MTKPTPSVAQLEREYAQAQRYLGQLGHISQGSVQDRTARVGGGAGYQWTRKIAGKTVTVALTPEQFTKMKEAVENYRKLRRQLRKMEQLSRRIIFQTTPHGDRRKHLSPQVLGIK
jgi:hypothetical protein